MQEAAATVLGVKDVGDIYTQEMSGMRKVYAERSLQVSDGKTKKLQHKRRSMRRTETHASTTWRLGVASSLLPIHNEIGVTKRAMEQ